MVAPRFSSDGKRIVYADRDTRGGDLWLLNLEPRASYRFTFDRRHQGGVWSPDGSQIATLLTAGAQEQSKWSIRFLATDGSGQVRTEVEGFWLSFDAKWFVMVFARYSEETKWDIRYMPLYVSPR